MYAKPELTRFGSLRELTLIGRAGASDGHAVWGAGCGMEGSICPSPTRS